MTEGVDDNTDKVLRAIRKRIEPTGMGVRGEVNESEEDLLPICFDPKEFLDLLRNSSTYKEIVERRYVDALKGYEKLKNYGEKPTKEEVIRAFEMTELFKQLFWNFNEDVLHLGYDPEKYSKDFRAALEDYKVAAEESLRAAEGEGKDRDIIIEKDRRRSEFHNKAARQLVKDGIVDNEYLGRILVRAFLVDCGKDYIQSARLSDQLRVLRNLEDRSAIVNFYQQVQGNLENLPSFGSEEIFSIRDQFLRAHPDTKYGNKNQYRSPRNISK